MRGLLRTESLRSTHEAATVPTSKTKCPTSHVAMPGDDAR